jgi:hypothetical protein
LAVQGRDTSTTERWSNGWEDGPKESMLAFSTVDVVEEQTDAVDGNGNVDREEPKNPLIV